MNVAVGGGIASYDHSLRYISVLPQDYRRKDHTVATSHMSSLSTAATKDDDDEVLHRHSRHRRRPSLVETLEEFLLARVPKGFENFLPKNARSGGGGDDDDKNNDDKQDNNNKDKKEKKKSNNFNNNNNRKKRQDEETQQQLAGATLLLLAVLMARSLLEDDVMTGDGPEVTWHDFYNYMLTAGDVERIVVINQKVARVYLRPGARGVPLMTSSSTNMNRRRDRVSVEGGGSATNTTDNRHPDDAWDDGTIMEMGSSNSSSSETNIKFPSSILNPSTTNNKSSSAKQLVYHFNIGSVESFEDKLSSSQRELNISPKDYVPVQYASETNWGIELIKSAPALFLIGMTAYMMRGMGGMPGAGGGRGGGMGGIFSMGKSNAKLIKKEDVSVTFKDVAGCTEAKREIMEFVDFLQDATQFTKLGAKIPKGAMLTGPPGTGRSIPFVFFMMIVCVLPV